MYIDRKYQYIHTPLQKPWKKSSQHAATQALGALRPAGAELDSAAGAGPGPALGTVTRGAWPGAKILSWEVGGATGSYVTCSE